MARGKKPNVAQRKALMKVKPDDWQEYLYLSSEMVEDGQSDHLSRDGVKELWYIFKHRTTGELVKARSLS